MQRLPTLICLVLFGASVAAMVHSSLPSTPVEPPLPIGDGPIQVSRSPLADQTWEELRSLHQVRATWWTRYYATHPGPRALRQLLGVYVDWIEALFDQDAIARAKPYADRLKATNPTDAHGVWLVARFMHFDQRFAQEEEYLWGHLSQRPEIANWWTELGNALVAQGKTQGLNPYFVAEALRARAREQLASPADVLRRERQRSSSVAD